MVTLNGYAQFKSEDLQSALAACETVRQHSVKEAGCLRYDYFQGSRDPNFVVFVEEWASKEALDTHFEQDAFKTFFGTIEPFLTAPPEIRIFESTLLG